MSGSFVVVTASKIVWDIEASGLQDKALLDLPHNVMRVFDASEFKTEDADDWDIIDCDKLSAVAVSHLENEFKCKIKDVDCDWRFL